MRGMDVVCLRCGCTHSLSRASWRCLQESECPRCGYVGWTPKPNGNGGGAQVVRLGRRLTTRRA
jgi:hypothetical protein